MFKFLHKTYDRFLKFIGKRPCSTLELVEILDKEIHTFMSYYHLQHTRSGFEQACKNRDYIITEYKKIAYMPKENQRQSIEELIQFVKKVNKLGFQ